MIKRIEILIELRATFVLEEGEDVDDITERLAIRCEGFGDDGDLDVDGAQINEGVLVNVTARNAVEIPEG